MSSLALNAFSKTGEDSQERILYQCDSNDFIDQNNHYSDFTDDSIS